MFCGRLVTFLSLQIEEVNPSSSLLHRDWQYNYSNELFKL